MAGFFPEHFAQVLEIASTRDVLFKNAEEEVLGMDHAEIGHYLATRWKLPLELGESIRYHHTPMRAKLLPPLSCAVHVADAIAWRAQAGSNSTSKAPEVHSGALETLGIDRETMDGWLPMIQKNIDTAYDLLGTASNC